MSTFIMLRDSKRCRGFCLVLFWFWFLMNSWVSFLQKGLTVASQSSYFSFVCVGLSLYPLLVYAPPSPSLLGSLQLFPFFTFSLSLSAVLHLSCLSCFFLSLLLFPSPSPFLLSFSLCYFCVSVVFFFCLALPNSCARVCVCVFA